MSKTKSTANKGTAAKNPSPQRDEGPAKTGMKRYVFECIAADYWRKDEEIVVPADFTDAEISSAINKKLEYIDFSEYTDNRGMDFHRFRIDSIEDLPEDYDPDGNDTAFTFARDAQGKPYLIGEAAEQTPRSNLAEAEELVKGVRQSLEAREPLRQFQRIWVQRLLEAEATLKQELAKVKGELESDLDDDD